MNLVYPPVDISVVPHEELSIFHDILYKALRSIFGSFGLYSNLFILKSILKVNK